MLFHWNERTDPAYNLALEEIMAEQSDEPFAMIWQNRPSVIIGRNQNAYAEFDGAYVREHGISVVRRTTGGGAVYHDLGNVNYTLLAFATDSDPRYTDFAVLAAPVVEALKSLGAEAEFSGRNDILVGGRKVSGSAKRVHDGRILFHGTLLFDADMDAMAAALTPSRDKIEAKGVASVRARVANLREFLPQFELETFPRAFADALKNRLGIAETTPIHDNWIREAERLADERYRSWDWTFGESPDFTFERTAKFPGGTVTAHLDIHQGLIRRARFTGDFFGASPATELAEALTGCPHRFESLCETLRRLEPERFIDGATVESLAELLSPRI